MKRYLVVFALFVLSLITYIDRVCISSAKEPMTADLVLTDQQMGAVFSAFALGYAIAQVPSGWFADRYGPRFALAAVVVLWSLFTAGTGLVQNSGVLWAVRFLFGIGEAGAFPGSARAIVNWLPAQERGRANGILFSGSRIGAALAFPLFAWLIPQFGWRQAFFLFGAIGIAWAIAWYVFFRNHPADHNGALATSRANAPQGAFTEKERLATRARQDAGPPPADLNDVSFGQVFRSRVMLLTMVQYFASNFTFFICLSWMLPFLQNRFELMPAEAAAYAMIPLLCGATSQWVAGFVVDLLYRSGWRAMSRRLPGMMGFGLSVAGLAALTQASTAALAVACFALATFGTDMTISPSWAYCMDIGGRNAGSVSGSMNMIGNFGSFVSANAFPWLLGLTGSANAYFVVAALLNLAAVACWLGMRPPSQAEKLERKLCPESASST